MQGHDVTFRDATIEDLGRIVEIYNSTVASRMVTADTQNVTTESRVKWFNDHNAERPLWVIQKTGDTNTIGWVSFQSFYGRPAYRHTVEISIYLDERVRGQGLGKVILEQSISRAQSADIKTLLGFIFGHNEPSLRLFRSFGFQDWALLPRIAELDGVERDLCILGKRIA
jgi:L-amino acid N-acyltransferase YncA